MAPNQKRKRDDAGLDTVALEVLEAIKKEARRIRSQSPDVRDMAKRLKSRARRALEDPKIDQDDLKDSWVTLLMLMDSRTAAATTKKKLEAQVKELKLRLEESRLYKGRMRFLLLIGDWIHEVHNRVKAGEKVYGHDWRMELQASLTASGMPTDEAIVIAGQYKGFFVTKGHRVSDTWDLVGPEVVSIKKWMADGEEGEGPSTPYLDRVGVLCKRVGVDRSVYLSLLQTARDRDCLAHNAAPAFEDFLDADGKEVDWQKVRAECNRRKRFARREVRKGRMTESQLEKFKMAVDAWWKVHVSGWDEQGKVITQDGFKKVLALAQERWQKKKKLTAGPVPVPESLYSPGKFDDLI
ncbi:hypothetical protein F66182_844 [Fusarium sp. NRRL 66182]|nr:hypothetical protein F66182_844 [Fusarium sp. NRRL 66182]